LSHHHSIFLVGAIVHTCASHGSILFSHKNVFFLNKNYFFLNYFFLNYFLKNESFLRY
jgi:hypothetical protein